MLATSETYYNRQDASDAGLVGEVDLRVAVAGRAGPGVGELVVPIARVASSWKARRRASRQVLVVDRGSHALVRPVPDDILGALRGIVPAGERSAEQMRATTRGEADDRERRKR